MPWMRKFSSNNRAAAAGPRRADQRARCQGAGADAGHAAELRARRGLGCLFISHNLAVVRRGGGDVPRPHRRAGTAPSGSSARRVVPILRRCWRRCRVSTPAPCRPPRRASHLTRRTWRPRVIITEHAFDRVNERGHWQATMARRMPGGRDACVVTVIVRGDHTLIVRTVMWRDLT